MKERKCYRKKIRRNMTIFGICLVLFLQAGVFPALAKPAWPNDVGIEGEAGIVIDEETGAVLFGQNIHLPFAPASITKLLTALVVIERCSSLDDVVTFSHDAVYNVEQGSSNPMALEEGDQITVRDCLYIMLLRSSNQAANALAEHIGGSREGFAAMMNEKIRELGCKESNFANPSGLNDENQYVSAYDMALIGQAAFANETLMEIDSAKSYRIASTINNPEGVTFSMEHKLLITTDSASETYYPAAVAGKTGYTSIALNTLVTCAKMEERGQVAVILKSNWTHYSDTIALMNFGFGQFENLDASGDEGVLFGEDGTISIGDVMYKREELEVLGSRKVTVPKGATLADVEQNLITGEEIYPQAPEGTVAEIRYTYDDRIVGRSYLASIHPEEGQLVEAGASEGIEGALGPEGTGDPGSEGQGGAEDGGSGSDPASASKGKQPLFSPKLRQMFGKIGPVAIGAGVFALVILAASLFAMGQRRRRREEEERRKERRRQRLAEIGCSEEDFKRMMGERYGKK